MGQTQRTAILATMGSISEKMEGAKSASPLAELALGQEQTTA